MVDEIDKEILFLFDCDKVHIYVVKPRITWVRPLLYEIKSNETRDIIKALLDELVDNKVAYFGTYDEPKERLEVEIKVH